MEACARGADCLRSASSSVPRTRQADGVPPGRNGRALSRSHGRAAAPSGALAHRRCRRDRGNNLAARDGDDYKYADASCPPPTTWVSSALLFSRRSHRTHPSSTSNFSRSTVNTPNIFYVATTTGDAIERLLRDRAARTRPRTRPVKGLLAANAGSANAERPREQWTAHAVVSCIFVCFIP